MKPDLVWRPLGFGVEQSGEYLIFQSIADQKWRWEWRGGSHAAVKSRDEAVSLANEHNRKSRKS